MIPSDESLITSQNSEPTPKSRKKTKPTMKRMTIRVDDVDESTKKWLANQKNVSASIRLLIDQASRQSVNDYITHCASLVGPPNQQQQPETVMFNKRADELEFSELTETEEMPQSVQVEPDLDLLDEDDNDGVTARLMNNIRRKRKRNAPLVGASFEDIMISESQKNE